MRKWMLTFTALGLSVLYPGLLGCALGGPERVDVPKDLPKAGHPVLGHADEARLLVYTPRYLDLNLGDGDMGPHWLYTGYTVYDEQGRKLEYVRNYCSRCEAPPSEVTLAPGTYEILLDKPEEHPALLRVTLEKGKTTEVDVESLAKVH